MRLLRCSLISFAGLHSDIPGRVGRSLTNQHNHSGRPGKHIRHRGGRHPGPRPVHGRGSPQRPHDRVQDLGEDGDAGRRRGLHFLCPLGALCLARRHLGRVVDTNSKNVCFAFTFCTNVDPRQNYFVIFWIDGFFFLRTFLYEKQKWCRPFLSLYWFGICNFDGRAYF